VGSIGQNGEANKESHGTRRSEARPLTHESSSVGARSSSAARVEQYPGKLETKQSQLTTLRKWRRVFDGGGRGRPRSDWRAFVCYRLGLLFDGGGRGRSRSDWRAFACWGGWLLFDGNNSRRT